MKKKNEFVQQNQAVLARAKDLALGTYLDLSQDKTVSQDAWTGYMYLMGLQQALRTDGIELVLFNKNGEEIVFSD